MVFHKKDGSINTCINQKAIDALYAFNKLTNTTARWQEILGSWQKAEGYKNIVTLNWYKMPPLPWVFPCAVKRCPIITIKNINNYILINTYWSTYIVIEGYKKSYNLFFPHNSTWNNNFGIRSRKKSYHETLVSTVCKLCNYFSYWMY